MSFAAFYCSLFFFFCDDSRDTKGKKKTSRLLPVEKESVASGFSCILKPGFESRLWDTLGGIEQCRRGRGWLVEKHGVISTFNGYDLCREDKQRRVC